MVKEGHLQGQTHGFAELNETVFFWGRSEISDSAGVARGGYGDGRGGVHCGKPDIPQVCQGLHQPPAQSGCLVQGRPLPAAIHCHTDRSLNGECEIFLLEKGDLTHQGRSASEPASRAMNLADLDPCDAFQILLGSLPRQTINEYSSIFWFGERDFELH